MFYCHTEWRTGKKWYKNITFFILWMNLTLWALNNHFSQGDYMIEITAEDINSSDYTTIITESLFWRLFWRLQPTKISSSVNM